MATQVFETEVLELQDGTQVVIKPLTIRRLREFMAVIERLEGVEKEDDALEIMIDAVSVALKSAAPDLAENREKLEDVIDMPTIHRILEVAGGVKLNDPNLAAAALVGAN